MSNSKEFEVIIPSAAVDFLSLSSIDDLLLTFDVKFVYKGVSDSSDSVPCTEFLVIAPSFEVASIALDFFISLRNFVVSSFSSSLPVVSSPWTFGIIRDSR